MSSLILAMPGSGKTTAMRSSSIQDVDYGYLRRSFGGQTDIGFIPELSSTYLKMLYLCSRKGVVASNCPELLSDYRLMGYNITVVVPDDPVRRYAELFKREEGVPCDCEKYLRWHEEWKSMAAENALCLYEGNVADVIPVVKADDSALYPLAKFVDAELVRNQSLWSIDRWLRCDSRAPSIERYVAILGDGLLEIELFRDGWSYSIWRHVNLSEFLDYRDTHLIGTNKKLPFLI